ELSKNSMIMDFTDMIYLPYQWNIQSTVKYDFIFIDECQDLSPAQIAVVLKFGKESSRILAVGDPRQSIYGFAGADIESFDKVKRNTKAKQFPLTSCFRCPTKVIELARSIRTDIVGAKQEEGNVEFITFEKTVDIARPGDLIISRLKAPLVILVFSFIDKNVSVNIHEDEVRDVINEIKSIFKQEELNLTISSILGGFETLKTDVLQRWRWIIKKDSERIVNAAERTLYVESETGYLKQRLEFLNRKYELWKLTCSTLAEIIEKIRSYVSASENSIRLWTIHRAKGLENDRVFILDYDELPLGRLDQKEWERVQELNLKYVAITRARKELFLIEAEKVEVLQEKSLFDILPFD
ncbi:MAG: UvrD-helicase domain-containing protein, partial [Chryseolinea sp.]